MRNNLLFGLAAFTLLLACKGGKNDQEGFKITGKIKTADNAAYVVLEEFTETSFKKIDSAKTSTEGTYEINGKITEPGFYRLNVYNKQPIVFVLENKAIEINADGTGPEAHFAIKGSKATDDFLKINKLGEEFQKEAQSLQMKAMVDENVDTAALIEEYDTLRVKYADKMKKEIREIGPSITAVFATNFLDKDKDFPFMDSVATVFEKELPNSKYSKQFVDNVKSWRKVAIGKPAPDINLTNPQGETVSLASLKGKYVLIDFWASWCKPCRIENPNVVKMYEKFKGKDFEILGVSLDNDKFKWTQAIDHDKLGWKHVSDLKGWESSVVPQYNISGIPATVLLDKDGKIIAKNLRGKDLEKKLEEIF